MRTNPIFHSGKLIVIGVLSSGIVSRRLATYLARACWTVRLSWTVYCHTAGLAPGQGSRMRSPW